MKKLGYLLVVLLISHCLNAQNAVAKIKYEQAEEAFAKDDYAVTLIKLDEAQKILGSTNPKILYLRLMAAKGILARGKYNWDFLETARKDAAYYIKQYSEVEGVEEKFRQVYEFSEALEALPKSRELFAQREAEALQAYNKSLATAKFTNYSIDGINTGMSIDELKSKKPEYFAGISKSTITDFDSYFLHAIPVVLRVRNNTVYFIVKNLFIYYDEDAGFSKGTAFINNLKNELGFDFDPVVTTKEQEGHKDIKFISNTTYQWQLNKRILKLEISKTSLKKSNNSVGTIFLEDESVALPK